MSHPPAAPSDSVAASAAPPSEFVAAPAPVAPAAPAQTVPSAASNSGPAAFPYAGLRASSEDGVEAPLSPTAFGGAGLQLERRQPATRSSNSPLDWAALVLAIVVAPIGLIVGIVAATVGSRSRGFASTLAKAAIAVGIVLTIILGVGAAVLAKLDNEQATHDAIAASSAAWCSQLESNPGTLESNTFGWPAPGNTIPASEKSIATYVAFWKKLDILAPSGIKGGTEQVESTAASIGKSLASTQTLDNSANVSQMQSVVANSGIQGWATEYCK